ncbi:hypothetical protein FACS1894219_04180 [Clostridia bacterium]|nr:hypothetical protein FACS1894219_04180 [Clostridia bacterium]
MQMKRLKRLIPILCLLSVFLLLSGCGQGETPPEEIISTPETPKDPLADFGPLPDKMLGYEGLEDFVFASPGSYNIPEGARILGEDEICTGWDTLYVDYYADEDGKIDASIIELQELYFYASSKDKTKGKVTQFRYDDFTNGERYGINAIENPPRDSDWSYSGGRLYALGMELVAWEKDGDLFAVGYSNPADNPPDMLLLTRKGEEP